MDQPKSGVHHPAEEGFLLEPLSGFWKPEEAPARIGVHLKGMRLVAIVFEYFAGERAGDGNGYRKRQTKNRWV